jgi:hypothetical protein
VEPLLYLFLQQNPQAPGVLLVAVNPVHRCLLRSPGKQAVFQGNTAIGFLLN